ncbi:ParB-like nuclease domain-containing protein [Marinobacter sp. es.048]|uniref:ParB N-terminal domain-containing protein n=1 Tax=Marinobacter sp. es.048 TaxID=1761795 RepID=UPI000B5948C0|nr:ParB N-terminal domain-containing protein [Marinobacter sp. es.048]SNC76962.1 ParB-like nuclease domain-containing protein [Marinobacter sp. es.048]
MKQENLDLKNVLLDPNNFRFQDLPGFNFAAEHRFHEPAVQARALKRIREEESIIPLKESILKNGYIPIEKIVVRPYEHLDNAYVVVEGNRRVATMKWILEDYHEGGVDIEKSVIDSISNLEMIVIESDGDDELFRASLMGIRHVSGIKHWGGYQRAKLVTEMRDKLDVGAQEVAARIGLSTNEVTRRYRAFKALEQMKESESYAEYASPSLYPIFHEAISTPAIKEWLNWDDGKYQFTDYEALDKFYSLISPEISESGEKPPKIKTYSQVRELKVILGKQDAFNSLLDLSRPFEDAYAIAKKDELTKAWYDEANEAIYALSNIGISELKKIDESGIELLERIKEVAQERLNDIEALRK